MYLAYRIAAWATHHVPWLARRAEEQVRQHVLVDQVHYADGCAEWFVGHVGDVKPLVHKSRVTLGRLTPAAFNLLDRGEIVLEDRIDRVSPDGSTLYWTQRARLA